MGTQSSISATLPPCPEGADESMEIIGLRSDNLLIPGLTCIPKTITTLEHEKEPRTEVSTAKSTSATESSTSTSSTTTTKSTTSTTQSTTLTTQSKTSST